MKLALVLLAVGCFSGCAAKAESGARAVVVSSPMVGYQCFAIQDADRKTVGGNCVKE